MYHVHHDCVLLMALIGWGTGGVSFDLKEHTNSRESKIIPHLLLHLWSGFWNLLLRILKEHTFHGVVIKLTLFCHVHLQQKQHGGRILPSLYCEAVRLKFSNLKTNRVTSAALEEKKVPIALMPWLFVCPIWLTETFPTQLTNSSHTVKFIHSSNTLIVLHVPSSFLRLT